MDMLAGCDRLNNLFLLRVFLIFYLLRKCSCVRIKCLWSIISLKFDNV